MQNKQKLVVVFIILALAGLACGGSISTANISSAKMTSDEGGTQETSVFAPDQIFYCIVELANAPDDTVVKAVWTAVSVQDTDPNTLIDSSTLTSGDGTLTFNLTNNSAWPVGSYKVELYLNDKLDRTLEFEVR